MSLKRLTPIKILIIIVCLLALIVGIQLLAGCTQRQEADAKKTGGAVAGLFGLPPVVGESLVGLVLIVSHTLTHKNAIRVAHRRMKKAAP